MKRTWRLRSGDYASTSDKRAKFRKLLLKQGCTAKLQTHELVFGELITNAIKYGDEPMFVTVSIDEGTMEIRVEDSGECFDLRASMLRMPTTEGGRGLHIVKALAQSLTVQRSAHFPCEIKATLNV